MCAPLASLPAHRSAAFSRHTGRPVTRSNPTIFPLSPATAARTAVSPARIASCVSTGETCAMLARPSRPGFSLRALYPRRRMTNCARCALTSPKYVARPLVNTARRWACRPRRAALRSPLPPRPVCAQAARKHRRDMLPRQKGVPERIPDPARPRLPCAPAPTRP